MPIQIEIKHEAATAALERMAAAGKDLRPALESVGAVGKARISLCFRQGKDPYGDSWPELKSREGQPLRKSGRLQRSYTYNVTKDGVVWGSNARHAAIHHFGGDIEAREAYSIKKIRAKKGKVFPIKLPNGAVIFRKEFRRRHTLAFKIGKRWVYAMKVTIPARPALPDADRGLPESWAKAIDKILERHAGGGDA